ncbi:MAG: transposase [Peptoniphilaceae bacterium]|nr:transposase [Peptoniphilaceae bacterium]MDY6086067.1 transposase [Peptoniphilaceae bacterium]
MWKKKPCTFLTGIDSNGYKEVLDFGLYPQESSGAYREMLLSLRKRGLEQVLLFVSDGLIGLPEVVTDVFPKAKHQSCWTHLIRNVLLHVRSRDKKEVAQDLKHVYHAHEVERGLEELQTFLDKWGSRYPKVRTIFKRKDNLFSFMAFPEQIRSSLYTNNLAESVNKSLKRVTKVKEQFPKEDALERCICSHFLSYNAKAESRRQQGFSGMHYELEEMFDA